MDRRKFLEISAIAPAIGMTVGFKQENERKKIAPVVISTWKPNTKANAAAWKVLIENGRSIDAVHQGVMIPEADPEDHSVGYGGLPDRDGRVTLDAGIMDHFGNCGAVLALEHIMHPVSVAKMVMEKSGHIYLADAGALEFALQNGFKREELLTEEARAKWKQWLKTAKYHPMDTVDNILESIKNQHDTIGMLALDNSGHLAAACTTSGLAFKMRGRVGDSPMIGAGLFVDGEVGAATATGVGEEVIRIVGSHTVVEMMRNGHSPEEACRLAIGRLVKLKPEKELRELQVGFIALSKTGEYGCYALTQEFTMAVRDQNGEKVIQSKSWFV